MSCGHCEKTVGEALAAVPGVVRVVRVDRGAGEAVIEGEADIQALVQAVTAKGYDARPG